MKKLRENRAETLIESLVSVLIAVMAFMILATAITTAGKINAKTRNTDVMFQYQDDEAGQTATTQLYGAKVTTRRTGEVVLHEDNGYYYYNLPDGRTAP